MDIQNLSRNQMFSPLSSSSSTATNSFTLTYNSIMNGTADKLVIFLAKEMADKLVKTFQYVSKLVHWQMETTHPDIPKMFKQWEVASGLSRKAFRSGRFLTGCNALRANPGSTPTFKFLSFLANAGEMVYFLFDNCIWLSRIGTLDSKLARKMSFISAFGESLGYIFFVVSDSIIVKKGLETERKLIALKKEGEDSKDDAKAEENVRKMRAARVMRLTAVAANVADLIIALADIEPNPLCNRSVTLGISAWSPPGPIGTEIDPHKNIIIMRKMMNRALF